MDKEAEIMKIIALVVTCIAIGWIIYWIKSGKVD